ncbi:MAG: hypothetical protein GY800_08485, partial [Planctomycetes bacterium]|nr:hypothetical protein [Planctomycetota bacterium]
NDLPDVPDAGPNQSVCLTTATLAGNDVTAGIGVGLWSLVSGSGTITTDTDFNSGLTALAQGDNTFRWTITEGACSLVDDVVITNDIPTTSDAGSDQTVCDGIATLDANSPAIGTGGWTIVAGSAVFADPTNLATGVTGLATGINTYRWTITNSACTTIDDVDIDNAVPTTSNAGTNQTICATTATLAGNNPTVGTGAWTVISGSATITDPTLFNTGLTDLAKGATTLRWTITSLTCSTFDDVVITNNIPSESDAGSDQEVCDGTTTLDADDPAIGSGQWFIIAGSASFATDTDFDTDVTVLGAGTNTLRWTITQGGCTSSDDVDIVNNVPTTADAGPDQSVCNIATATLAGNNPVIGVGQWSVVSGTATFTDPLLFNTDVTSLGSGANVLKWTVTHLSCNNSDEVTITNNTPTTADAGSDQTLCADNATFDGNIPSISSGEWTIVSGNGAFADATVFNTVVSNLNQGVNEFKWTITNNGCTTEDNVIITNDLPDVSDAGPDQTDCLTSATL